MTEFVGRRHHRIPIATLVVNRRQADGRRVLREGERSDPLGRHPFHLLGRQGRIPHRDQHEGDVTTRSGTAPLLDDPVVVVLEAFEPELAITCLHEELTAEPREGREAQRRQDPRPVHVLQARRGVVAAGAHIGVGQRLGAELLLRLPRHRAQSGARESLPVVDPVVHAVDGLHVRRPITVLRRHPVDPKVRRFQNVVVDRDQPVKIQVRSHCSLPCRSLR